VNTWDEAKRQVTLAECVHGDMTGKRRASKTTWIDPDDAPELTDDWFAKAKLRQGDKLVRRGGRPKKAAPKEAANIRLDPDVLAHFRAGGSGWQSQINAALRKVAGLK
jgi:uncharacterized protein (DUF4415 family)